MKFRRPQDESVWNRHGYLFFILFSSITVFLSMLGVRLFGIPTDVPLKEVVNGAEVVWLFLGLVICIIVAYYGALLISDLVKALIAKIWRDIPWL